MDRGILRQMLIGFVCSILIIDCGLHEGWSTPTIPKFNGEDPLKVTNDEIAWIVNLMYVGVGIGSLVPFLLMDNIGRKGTLLVTTIPKIISWLFIGLSTSVSFIYVGRILAGLGCGITYAVMPMYLGEISSKRTRGPLGTLMAVLINIGMLLIYAIGLWVSRFVMAMISVCAPILFLLTFIWLPESSVFLTRKNKLDPAERTLQWALGKENVDEELEEVKRIVETEDKCSKMTLKDMFREIFTKAQNRKAFRIAMILLSGLTLTGAAPILAYQSYIYDEAGFEISTNTSIILTGVAIVLAGATCVTVVRFTGKRLLLLIAAPICVVSLATIAIFFELQSSGYNVSWFKWVPTVFVVIYVLGFGFSLNPIPLAYIGEIFGVEVKVPAAVLNALYYAISTTAVVKFYQVVQELYGTFAPLWVFTAITFLIWVLIYLFVPETEGKTLEEIQLELRKKRRRKRKEQEILIRNCIQI
ncbi:facilitated trehalose transporter Tret1-like isoform X1 [Cataglyphis hispanica]|uniref:facilitated trehalose transporter Tret1-like isoform X1 n=2 Tax=Cataglyphis hispanica TaxID=1086592 RepID=UPI00217F9C30|nr:facilitated trehalose transporter Tret1-like isoform X1 [Cataglyphis hispanica]XP_050447745.1 facilitated trehalose transporter Tret1-like isoform X1 [Cataglyphis hispanica]XP_050447747.1 facilitated trehalose transporter Tret1-like isoform X1 [Cataglyphis hispanica]XP_050447748.1 facilitated trehalose transporter Tret1-like isoform X1 [Cataglyphis hispanica]XP_050447749.1 facilitated trehalose transporter Tret1-like isoform X1 [Cataglyphis hispanica]XP_050447750.1 facilitated trehalose tra